MRHLLRAFVLCGLLAVPAFGQALSGLGVSIGPLANRPATGGIYFVNDAGSEHWTWWDGVGCGCWKDVAPGLSSGGQIPSGYVPATGGGVPTTRLVCGDPLSADVICTKSDVGLANADNTSDANKPISTAGQTALNLKDSILSFSGALSRSVNAISCLTASGSQAGCLSTADWTAFNGKQAALGFTPANSTITVNAQPLSSNVSITTISGNSGSATVLQTARAINGVNFDGSAPITVTAAAGTLSGNTLAAGVTASSLTSVGTLSAGVIPTSLLGGTVTNAQLAGSIDLTSKVVNVLPFALGGNSGSAATSGTSGTVSVSMVTAVITCTPTGAMTLNFTGGVAGEVTTFIFTTSGVSSFVITFGTNAKSQGTLATGTTTGKVFSVSFRCKDGTTWVETGRTIAM